MSITPSVSNTLVIAGDPTGSVFSGVAQGIVRLTNHTSDNAAPTPAATLTSSKGYWTMQNMYVEGFPISGHGTTSGVLNCTDANNITITNSVIVATRPIITSPALKLARTVNSAYNVTVTKCFLSGARPVLITSPSTGSAFSTNITITDSILFRGGIEVISPTGGTCTGGGITMRNCSIEQGYGSELFFTYFIAGVTSFPCYVTNCNLYGTYGSTGFYATAVGHVIEDYNRLNVQAERILTATGSNTISQAVPCNEYVHSRLFGLASQQSFAPYNNAASIGVGTTTGAPAADMFGVTWPSTPDIGPITRFNVSSSSVYVPTERNASAITIAPASTSQSIELYLGATGLVFNTSGLAAYYVRNQSAPVAITLVTQTPTGAWASGGFAEISSSLVPGVYRLDVPNAAFAAGASDVTIVVRGASGTNGAVLTVTLSSGGLTAAQTAAAVWDEARASHTTVGTFGQYVNAELVTPVTSAALVRMGPFEVRADGLGASDPLDIQKGAQHGIDIQCVDNNGAGIDITSATVTAKVYNSGATLVDTYSCTATYAADGRATFTIDTTVTNTPGTYTATITRTTGASDTQVFGPLRIYVRDI
jgi:hypothetical protein